MAKTLDALWYNYQIEKTVQADKEQKDLIHRLALIEKKLASLFNNEQAETFEEFDICINELHGLTEKDAFVKGIRFATQYLIEALCER